MKNIKLLLVAFIAISLFACNKKSRLTENGGFGENQDQTMSPQILPTAGEFLSNISGIWLVNVEPIEHFYDKKEISQLDLSNRKEALPVRYEFKDNTFTVTSLDENVSSLPPFQMTKTEMLINRQAFFHNEYDFRSDNEDAAKNYKKFTRTVDVALDVSESAPYYILSYNYEQIDNEDKQFFITAQVKVTFTEKIGTLEDKVEDVIPYHFVTQADLQNKEFELKLSKPGLEAGQEIVTKMFMNSGSEENSFSTSIRDFSSEIYNSTLYGKNIVYTSQLVHSDMKPQFIMDMSFITDDSRYELVGYYFLENGHIIMRGKYRIQNIRIKEWNKTLGFNSDIGGDWEIDSFSFEPVREEGSFEAVEVTSLSKVETKE